MDGLFLEEGNVALADHMVYIPILVYLRFKVFLNRQDDYPQKLETIGCYGYYCPDLHGKLYIERLIGNDILECEVSDLGQLIDQIYSSFGFVHLDKLVCNVVHL